MKQNYPLRSAGLHQLSMMRGHIVRFKAVIRDTCTQNSAERETGESWEKKNMERKKKLVKRTWNNLTYKVIGSNT